MKFRNPKTGEVFSVSGMMDDWCGKHCKGLSCPINNLAEKVEMSGRECEKWIITHPHEAARLMGYEVLGDDCDRLRPVAKGGGQPGGETRPN